MCGIESIWLCLYLFQNPFKRAHMKGNLWSLRLVGNLASPISCFWVLLWHSWHLTCLLTSNISMCEPGPIAKESVSLWVTSLGSLECATQLGGELLYYIFYFFTLYFFIDWKSFYWIKIKTLTSTIKFSVTFNTFLLP